MAMDPKKGLLIGHKGCVNHVQFNESGSLLASGSDDTRICLWDLASSSPLATHATGHKANIFCVKFMPGTGDSSQPLLASCAGDAEVRLHDLASGARSVFSHHGSRVKKLVTEPGNPHLLLSCSEDGTVRQLDVREAGGAPRQLLQLARNGVKLEINSISSPWHKPWLLGVGASDDALRVYDRRVVSSSSSSGGSSTPSRASRGGPRCVGHFTPTAAAMPGSSSSSGIGSDCITGVAFADDGRQVLANHLGGYVYLWTLSDGMQVDRQATPAAAEVRQPGLGGDEEQQPQQHQHAGEAAAEAEPGQARRMMSVDDAVVLLQRGELALPRRRRGMLASMVLSRAQDLFERGELDASLRYARAALQLRPNYGMAHYTAAMCLEAQGQPAAALAEGQAALEYAWSYDLQAFVRRLRRSVAGAAAAGAAADDDDEHVEDGEGAAAEQQQQQDAQQPAVK
ncbi:hypothetical protein OEZ85_003775 [Tetradesmus obliquus]|uniref:Anaphase-promoting complex subunit 4 WD40 domain-containing protein n=1 Tax=Tetradesmus obliquus TaxID=3088 RepID=A0ABY8UFM6_TETOB|nr:hypothetical protein OEZ85_003775 [Tetradesmus obliquus]